MAYSSGVSTPSLYPSGVFRRNRLLLCVIALHLLCGVGVSVYLGTSFWSSTAPMILVTFKTLSMIMVANVLLWRLGVAVFKVKPKKPIQWMIADLRSILSNRTHVSDAVTGFFCMLVLIITFTYLKEAIPLLNPYSWDSLFAQMDRSMHGGYDVWVLLHPILGSPYVTTAISWAYHGWFMLIYMAVCLACLDRRDPSRSAMFLVAFALCWTIGGNLLATVFASVGPVYYEVFGFGDTFVQQMDLLHQSHEISPIGALKWHQVLLDGYFNGGSVRGISAMPSMHVATSVLLALYGFTYSRWAGWALTAFTVVIVFGSVHLAWHYAVDGYASIILALAVWWLAKKLTARFGPAT